MRTREELLDAITAIGREAPLDELHRIEKELKVGAEHSWAHCDSPHSDGHYDAPQEIRA